MSGKYQDPTEKNGPAIVVTMIFVVVAIGLLAWPFLERLNEVMTP